MSQSIVLNLVARGRREYDRAASNDCTVEAIVDCGDSCGQILQVVLVRSDDDPAPHNALRTKQACLVINVHV